MDRITTNGMKTKEVGNEKLIAPRLKKHVELKNGQTIRADVI